MITVRNLCVGRGGVALLRGVEFTADSGQMLILRGPNGVGKTTLLRSLAGLQPAWEGEIAVDPEDIVYAGHQDGIKAQLSVSENLRFWAEVFGFGPIDAALERFGLTALADRPGGALSAGQKRRLGLARLAVSGRRIWLLDEPTVSLDSDSTARFGEIIRAHLADGGVVIAATHIDLGIEGSVLDLEHWRVTADEQSGDPFLTEGAF